MKYALLFYPGELTDDYQRLSEEQQRSDGRLFAGLANGQLWGSRDQADTWTQRQLRGDTLDAIVALG